MLGIFFAIFTANFILINLIVYERFANLHWTHPLPSRLTGSNKLRKLHSNLNYASTSICIQKPVSLHVQKIFSNFLFFFGFILGDTGTVLLRDTGAVLLSLKVLHLLADATKLSIIIIWIYPRGQGRPKGKGEVRIASLPW